MPDTKTKEVLKESGLFDRLTDRECELLFDMIAISEKSFDKREIVVHEGSEVQHFYIVKKGKVIGEKFHIEGETDLLNVFEKGEIFGIEAASSTFKTSPLTYTADIETTVVMIEIESLLSCSLRETVLENIAHLLSDISIRQMYKIQVLSKHGLRERIMAHLLIMRRKRNTEVFDIRMTQEQLAQYLCVNRSALSYELNRMKKEGIIDFKKSKFKIF